MDERRAPGAGSPPESSPQLKPEVPLIWRDSERVHFGDHPVPLRLTEAEVGWLTELAGARTWSEARDACPGGAARADLILAHARSAGAIDEPDECWWLTPPARAAARPELLALGRWHADPGRALAARAGCVVAVDGEESIAHVLIDLLAACSLRTADPDVADIVVLAATGHVDAVDPHDEHSRRPHLPVRVHHARAAIGPLVLPGRTACCRCLALHARDRDADWPGMAAQWRAHRHAGVPGSGPDRLLAHRAASEAVAMLRAWIDEPRSAAPHRVHVEAPRMTPRREPIRPHGACGCLWQHIEG